jgi:hypothetical protein
MFRLTFSAFLGSTREIGNIMIPASTVRRGPTKGNKKRPEMEKRITTDAICNNILANRNVETLMQHHAINPTTTN